MKIQPCTSQKFSFKSNETAQNRTAQSKNMFKNNKKVLEYSAGAVFFGAVLFALTRKPGAIKSLNGKIILSSAQAASFKKQMKQFASDIDYRKNILKSLKMNVEDYALLRPIAGPEEYKNIVKEFNSSAEHYSPGKTLITPVKDGFDMSGVKNHKYRASFHNHTTHSDGRVSVQKRLDDAAKYADEVAESIKNDPQKKTIHAPFTIAITDHDTFEGCKEAVKIISADPWKYRNLRVVLGAELSAETSMVSKELKEPIPLHLLIHGINPFDEKLNKFLNNKKGSRHDLLKGPFLDMEEIIDIIKNQKYGYISIAHPGLINIGESLKNPAESLQGMSDLFKAFKEKGGERALGAEIYYHYFGPLAESKEWLESINKFAKANKLFSCGGLDSHGSSIFYSDR